MDTEKRVNYLTDDQGNPSSLRLVFKQFFWVVMLILVFSQCAEIYTTIQAGEVYKTNETLMLILLCMLFFPKLVQKVIELRFPGLKDQLTNSGNNG